MARAKRHYIPGQVWHLTHRCHKREFLLRFAKDKSRWVQWLIEAKRRYGLTILNYIVTSNHIHLLVVDDGERQIIPRAMQLTAGRCAQEYNNRKIRTGAYWEDRYHATAVETGEHLLRCLVYIDSNMVRAGVVDHPSEWIFGGYNEIQTPRRKNIIIAYEKLAELAGCETYSSFRALHKQCVNDSLGSVDNVRDSRWTQSIAAGGESFVKRVKAKLCSNASGRKLYETIDGYELREEVSSYIAFSDPEKSNIDLLNTYKWDTFTSISSN